MARLLNTKCILTVLSTQTFLHDSSHGGRHASLNAGNPVAIYNNLHSTEPERKAVPKGYFLGVAKGRIQYVRMPAPEMQKSLSCSG